MLQDETAAILRKHSWVYYENRSNNKSQSFKRAKDKSNKAFTHLSLLATKLPDDKYCQIFNQKNIAMLLKSMMVFKTGEHDQEEPRDPDLRIAEFLVQFGLNIIIKEYKKLSWYTPEIAQLTLDHLLKTEAICHDISISAETTNLETEASQNQRRYLFTWKRISKEDRLRFQNFVFGLISKDQANKKNNNLEEMKIKYFRTGMSNLHALIMKQEHYQGEYEEDYEKDDPEGTEEGWINLVMRISDSTAILTIHFLEKSLEKTLNMEYRNDDYYFYDKVK